MECSQFNMKIISLGFAEVGSEPDRGFNLSLRQVMLTFLHGFS